MKKIFIFTLLTIGFSKSLGSNFSVQFFANSNESLSELQFFSDEKRDFSALINTSSNAAHLIRLFSSDIRVATLVQNETTIRIPKPAGDFFSLEIPFQVVGVRLGKTLIGLSISHNITNISADIIWKPVEHANKLTIILLKKRDIKDVIFRIIVIIFVVVMTTCMGASLDIQVIKEIFKKPKAPVIGFFCQFVVMPNLALAISQSSTLDPAFGLGLLTMGCAPGGGSSNAWTVLLNGNLNLSIMMTFLSNIFGLAMMPFWLFVYGRFYIDFNQVEIPYVQIFYNLLQLIIPCLVGLFISVKIPKLSRILSVIIKPITLIFILFLLTFGTYNNLYMYALMLEYPTIIPISACLPWFGFIFGYLTARLCRQNQKESVTIALETGIQNVGIPILILLYSMPKPEGELGAIVPLIISLTTPIPLYFILIGRTIHKKCASGSAEISTVA